MSSTREVELLADLEEGDRFGGELHRQRLHSPGSRLSRHDLPVRRVVVDDEDPPPLDLWKGVRRDPRRYVSLLRRQRDLERRALPRLALDADRPAHQLDDALRDREPEPGAAVAPSRGGVDLAEGREQPVHPILRDPDAGIADGELDAPGALPGRLGVDVHDDLALLGELDRVREQVEQDLSQAGHVPHDSRRHGLAEQAAELHVLLHRTWSNDLERPLDALAQVERLSLQIELAGLDLRVVEDVVDHVEQGVAARSNHLGKLTLLR